MPANRIIRRKVEIYASTLFEFASKQGTEAQSLHALELVTQSVAEVRSSVLALCELHKAYLLADAAEAYARLSAGDDALEASEATAVAKILDAAERNEHHEARVLADLRQISAAMTPECAELLGVIGTGADQRLLPQIVAKLSGMVVSQGSTVLVEVTTAIELDDVLRQSVVEKMREELGRPVYLVEHVDPAIIGGLVISVGDDLRDASVRTQLANMRETLMGKQAAVAREVLSDSSVGGDGK